MLCMNSAWYGRAQMTRILMRRCGSQPAKPSMTYSRGRVLKKVDRLLRDRCERACGQA